MNRFINRLKLVFLGLFGVSCAVLWTYQLMYARPQAQCEGKGGWWDWHERTCATPLPLYVFTGKGDTRHIEKRGPGGVAVPDAPAAAPAAAAPAATAPAATAPAAAKK